MGWVNKSHELCYHFLMAIQTDKEKGYLRDFYTYPTCPIRALSLCGTRHFQDRRCAGTVSWTRVLHERFFDDLYSNIAFRYKDAGEALRRKQDKEREAAGLPPVQRLGARAATQRGGRGAGPPVRGRGGGAPSFSRGGAPGGPRTFHQTDKNLYVHLLGHLRKKNLLPVVVFTFSKKRCEENAGTLTNQDLCTSGEKSEVHVTIEKALSRLKGLWLCFRALWTTKLIAYKKVPTRNFLR